MGLSFWVGSQLIAESEVDSLFGLKWAYVLVGSQLIPGWAGSRLIVWSEVGLCPVGLEVIIVGSGAGLSCWIGSQLTVG